MITQTALSNCTFTFRLYTCTAHQPSQRMFKDKCNTPMKTGLLVIMLMTQYKQTNKMSQFNCKHWRQS